MKFFKKITLVLCAASLASCSDFFEQTPDNMLDADDNYTERSNIYASFMGLYGTLQDVAPKLVVTSELWGDLLTPTTATGRCSATTFSRTIRWPILRRCTAS